MKVKFVNADEMKKEMRVAGWMASVSTDTEADQMKIAEHCAKSGHGTPFRATRFVFEVSEVSRVLSHELVRHEIGLAKVQRSQRYVKEDGFKYVTPKGIMDIRVLVSVPIIDVDGVETFKAETWLNFDQFQDIVKQMYNGYTEQGAKAEDARYALTNATFTKLHLSFDLEALQQFCYRRCCTRAQWEIRELADVLKYFVVQELPVLEPLLGAPCQIHGYCPEVKGCGRAPSKQKMKEMYELAVKSLEKAEKVE